MDMSSRRQSPRSGAVRAVPSAHQSVMMPSLITHAAVARDFASSPAALLNHHINAPFSRGINVAGYQEALKNFFTPRLANVNPYTVPITNGPGRKKRNDFPCVVMEMVRVIISDFSISEALYILECMSTMPEFAGINWKVTYSTFRKRTEANTIHNAHYKGSRNIESLTWTTANHQYAHSLAQWGMHMEMFAEVIVAVQAVHAADQNIDIVFDAIEMACKVIAILDTINPEDVPLQPVNKQKGKPAKEKKEKKEKKRSRVVAELEAPVSEPAVRRSSRTKMTCSPVSDDHIMDLDPAPAANIAAVPATTIAIAPAPASAVSPAPAPVLAVEDEMASLIALFDKFDNELNNEEVEEETQRLIDEKCLHYFTHENITLEFPDALGFNFLLDDLKVYEIDEPAVQAAPIPVAEEQQILQQLELPDTSFENCASWDDLFNFKLDANGRPFI